MERLIRRGNRRSPVSSHRRIIKGFASLSSLLGLGVSVASVVAIHDQRRIEQQNLFTLRQVVSQYTLEHQKRARSFDELIEAGYLKSTPSYLPAEIVEMLFGEEPEIRDAPLPDFPFGRDSYDPLLAST